MSVRYFVSKGRQTVARVPVPQDVDNFDVRSGKYFGGGSDSGTRVDLPPGYIDLQQIPLPAYPQKQRVT